LAWEPAFEILWILSEQRRLEVQKTLDTLTQTSDYINCGGSGLASKVPCTSAVNPRVARG